MQTRKAETIAEMLLQYYGSTRGAGHSRAVLEGARNVDDTRVLVATYNVASALDLDTDEVATPATVERGELLGLRQPLVFDNSGTMVLLEGLLGRIQRKDATIDRLRDKLNSIRNTVSA